MVLDCHYAFQQTWAFIQKLLSRQKICIKTLRALSSAPLPFLRSDKLFQHYEHLNIYMPLSISKLHLIQLKRQQKQFKKLPAPPPPLRNKQRPLMQASALSKCTHKIRPLLGLSWKGNCQANAKQRVAVFPRHVFTSHHLFKATPFNLPVPLPLLNGF